MNKKRVYIALFAFILITVFATAVQAQLLDPILRPLQQIDIVGTYQRFGFVIDAILYFVILVGAAQTGLGDRFKDNKSITVAVGIILGIAAAIGEQRTGFRLGALWPLALMMALLAIGFTVYNYFKKVSGAQNRGFAMLGFAFLFFYFQSAAPGLAREFERNPNQYVRLIWALLNIIAIVCLVWGIIELVRGIANWGAGGAGGGGGAGGAGGAGERGGPGLWQRLFGGGEKTPEDLDYTNPGTVVVKVTDMNEKPIYGAQVIIKGEKLKYRLPIVKKIFTKWTQPPNGEAVFDNMPSGLLRAEARHPNYKFWKFYVSRKSSRHTGLNTFYLQAGETAEVTIQLKMVEKGGRSISGRVIDYTKTHALGIDHNIKGSKLNDVKKYPGIGIASEKVYALVRDPNNPAGYSPIPGAEAVTDGSGIFKIEGVPAGRKLFVGVRNYEFDENHPLAWITHEGSSMMVPTENGRFEQRIIGGIYSRGGRGELLSYGNPPPPKPIELGTRHRNESNVVISVALEKEAEEDKPPVVSAAPPTNGIVKGNVFDDERTSTISVGVTDPVNYIRRRFIENGAGVEGADVWAEDERGNRLAEPEKTGANGAFTISLPGGINVLIKAKKDDKQGSNTMRPWGRPQAAIPVVTGKVAIDIMVLIKKTKEEKKEIDKIREIQDKVEKAYGEQKELYGMDIGQSKKFVSYVNKLLSEGLQKGLGLGELRNAAQKAKQIYDAMSPEERAGLEEFKPDFMDYLIPLEDNSAYTDLVAGIRAEEKEKVFTEHEEGGHPVLNETTDNEIFNKIRGLFNKTVQYRLTQVLSHCDKIFRKEIERLEREA